MEVERPVWGEEGVRNAVIREVLTAWALERREELRPTLPPCPVCEIKHWPLEECVFAGPPYPLKAIGRSEKT